MKPPDVTELNLTCWGLEKSLQDLKPPPSPPRELGVDRGQILSGAVCPSHLPLGYLVGLAPILRQGELGPPAVGWALPGGGGVASDEGFVARTDACHAAAAAAGFTTGGCGSLFREDRRGKGDRGGAEQQEPAELGHTAAFHSSSPFYFALFPVARLPIKL